MISLKRNSKLELVPALGVRKRQSSIYTPFQKEKFKISRGKFNDFLTCPKCFYFDRVKGLSYPSLPGWTLNETTDLLLKKEFDLCREQQLPHKILIDSGLEYIVPFKHPDINLWRDSLRHGLMTNYQNIILTGGVDDIWINTNTQELIIVDYKSQASSNKLVEIESYLTSPYHQGYKLQMDFYNFLLSRMGFKVSSVSYFLVCNAHRDASGFFGRLDFSQTLIPYEWSSEWIPEKLNQMLQTLNNENIPESNISCENCAYAKQRCGI